MKLGLVFGSVLFLITGITLAGNSLEVTGLSDLELTNIAANATANATATAMGEANKLLRAATNATANATTDVMKKEDPLSSAPKPTANKAINETSHTYENTTQGIRFQYPPNWREEINDFPYITGVSHVRPVAFFITVPKLDSVNTTSSNASECAGNEPKGSMKVIMLEVLKKCDVYKMYIVPIELDNPNISQPCLCTTLKDFIRWDYNRSGKDKQTFINDNQTTIGNNYSAWQIETVSSKGDKDFEVYAINGNLGYSFIYSAPADSRFDQYLDGFKNMLKTVAFTPPIPEKKPSFLNSSDTANTSSNTAAQDKSFKILSSNDFIDSLGYLHVVGEVENNSPTVAQFVKITGTFYDTNNQVVATDFTYTNPFDIGSGQKAPFELTLSSASIPVSQIHHYNLQASYQ